MAKISVGAGPSDGLAQPGDTATDALQRESALHPEEQAAMPLEGEGDESKWLSREGDDAPSHGNSSSASDEKQQNSDEKKSSDDQAPARTTENPSGQDRAESSTARSEASGTTRRATASKK